jgi:hypothetical protein
MGVAMIVIAPPDAALGLDEVDLTPRVLVADPEKAAPRVFVDGVLF